MNGYWTPTHVSGEKTENKQLKDKITSNSDFCCVEKKTKPYDRKLLEGSRIKQESKKNFFEEINFSLKFESWKKLTMKYVGKQKQYKVQSS